MGKHLWDIRLVEAAGSTGSTLSIVCCRNILGTRGKTDFGTDDWPSYSYFPLTNFVGYEISHLHALL